MFKNNMQLPKAYIEEIASNWKSLNYLQLKKLIITLKISINKKLRRKKNVKVMQITHIN